MLFSIIVPVYNVKKYLENCIESILKQTYKDYELIIIDDGSDDGSAEICDKYSLENENVIAIHTTNRGQSSARNLGIAHAKGEYLMFIDSDDSICTESLSVISKITEKSPDIIVTEYYSINEVSEEIDPSPLFFAPEKANKAETVEFIFAKKPHCYGPVQYIIKRSFVENNSLRFREGLIHEDIDWTVKAISYANNFEYYCYPWYLRLLYRNGSTTNTVNPKRTLDVLTIVIDLLSSDIMSNYSSKERITVENKILGSLFYSLRFCAYYSDKDQHKIINILNKNYAIISKKTREIKYKIFIIACRLIGYKLMFKIIRRKLNE